MRLYYSLLCAVASSMVGCENLNGAVDMGRKRQLGVALEDRLREQLEALASKAGRSIADEIRQRVERTLEQDALAPLVAAASESGRSVADEIMRRLETTFFQDQFDLHTRKLGYDIMMLARAVEETSTFGWYAHPKGHEAMTEAVISWLEGLKPRAVEGAADQLWGPDEPRLSGERLHVRTGAKRRRRRTSAAIYEVRSELAAISKECSEDIKKGLVEDLKKAFVDFRKEFIDTVETLRNEKVIAELEVGEVDVIGKKT